MGFFTQNSHDQNFGHGCFVPVFWVSCGGQWKTGESVRLIFVVLLSFPSPEIFHCFA
jgi:hypothetical protein